MSLEITDQLCQWTWTLLCAILMSLFIHLFGIRPSCLVVLASQALFFSLLFSPPLTGNGKHWLKCGHCLASDGGSCFGKRPWHMVPIRCFLCHFTFTAGKSSCRHHHRSSTLPSLYWNSCESTRTIYNRTGETILHLFLQLKHQRILICAGVRPIYSEAPTTLLHFRAGSASTTKVTLTMKFNVVSRRHSGPESLERQLTTSLKQQRQSPSIFVDRTH